MNASTLLLEWKVDASPFRNRVVLQQMGLVFGIPIVLLGLFMVAITEQNRWQVALQVMAVTGGVMLGLLLLVMLVFTLVGYEQHFQLDDEGVQAKVSGRTSAFLKLVRIGLLFSGRPSAMGAGLVMRTGDAIRWRDVAKVEVDERQRQMTLYRKGGSPFLLACTAENFATVREIVQAKTGA
ncbi:hypothetical protein A6A03_04815 [Chloroflexus islandicus]|uniref:Uncharacterized protein n=1 Tax=Chloroflexus islandicus TaxID=1707952 RepID=A0A178LVE3_9CHLR|nr:hypothetical protein [Chloroflexus islandicus]OAN38214.1 hypothetical protein A6A03_04815 [Chloroflexus islandicus]